MSTINHPVWRRAGGAITAAIFEWHHADLIAQVEHVVAPKLHFVVGFVEQVEIEVRLVLV